MRILHVSSEYPPQKIFGLGRYVAGLSAELAAQGHEVHVLTNSIGGADQDVVDRGVHIHRVDYPPPPKPPAAGAPVMAFNLHLQQRSHFLGREALGNPEVLVSHDWLTALAGHRIAGRLGIPHLWTVHDTVHGKRAGQVEAAEDRVTHQIECWAARTADLVLVNSRAIGDEVRRIHHAPGSRVELLHPGIDAPSEGPALPPSRLQAFRSLFAKPGELLVTFTGRMDLEKGIDTLINAFALLRRRRPDVRLALAGRGVLQPMIEEHLEKLGLKGSVSLPGYLEGEVLSAFYQVGDIHVCPSHYEPFGLVVLEAMRAGMPVVVSDTGGLRDIVSAPRTGRRAPPRDPAALASALEELARDPGLRKRLGESGRTHALEQFAWPRLAREAGRLYGKAASSRKAVSA